MKEPEARTNQEKPKRERRFYDAEFKRSCVEHCRRQAGDVKRAARELGVNYWTLRGWMGEASETGAVGARERTVEELEAENRRLKAELERVTEQREILKKSLGILSRP
jgi:transposase